MPLIRLRDIYTFKSLRSRCKHGINAHIFHFADSSPRNEKCVGTRLIIWWIVIKRGITCVFLATYTM